MAAAAPTASAPPSAPASASAGQGALRAAAAAARPKLHVSPSRAASPPSPTAASSPRAEEKARGDQLRELLAAYAKRLSAIGDRLGSAALAASAKERRGLLSVREAFQSLREAVLPPSELDGSPLHVGASQVSAALAQSPSLSLAQLLHQAIEQPLARIERQLAAEDEGRLSLRERLEAQYADLIRQMKTHFDEQLELTVRRHDVERAELRARLAEQRSAAEAAAESIRRQLRKELEEQQAAWAPRVREAERVLASAESERETLQAEIARLRTAESANAARWEREKAALEQRVALLEADNVSGAQQLEAVKTLLRAESTQRRKVEEELSRQQEGAAAELDHATLKLREEKELAVQAVKQSSVLALESVKSSLQSQLVRAGEAHTRELERLRQEWGGEREALLTQVRRLEAALQESRAEASALADQVQAAKCNSCEATRRTLAAEVQLLKEAYSSQLSALKEQTDAQLAELQATYAKQLEGLARDTEAALKARRSKRALPQPALSAAAAAALAAVVAQRQGERAVADASSDSASPAGLRDWSALLHARAARLQGQGQDQEASGS